MGVDVDVARGDEGPVGVDLTAATAVDLADGGDHPVVDGDVSGTGLGTGPVDDAPGPDHQIVWHGNTSGSQR